MRKRPKKIEIQKNRMYMRTGIAVKRGTDKEMFIYKRKKHKISNILLNLTLGLTDRHTKVKQ